MNFKTPSRAMAAAITLWLMALFTLSYLVPMLNVSWIKTNAEFDTGLQQTLLVLLVAAIGYYINTSKSSEDKNETIRQQAATAAVIAGAAPAPALGTTPTGTPDDPVSVTETPKP